MDFTVYPACKSKVITEPNQTANNLLRGFHLKLIKSETRGLGPRLADIDLGANQFRNIGEFNDSE
jgi:hypothetical protein